MARAHRIKAECQRLLHEGIKFDALVAAHAGVGRATGLVFGHEVVDHVRSETLTEIPHVIGNAELGGGPLGIHRVFDGAASPGTGAQGSGHAAQREVHADHVVTGLDRARGSNSGIHSATHCCQNPHNPILSVHTEVLRK